MTPLFQCIIILSLFLSGLNPIYSDQPTGHSIMKTIYDQNKKYETRIAKVKMVIKNNKNETRDRFFHSWKKYYDDNTSRGLIKFFRPATVKGMSLLSHSHASKNTDQWLYFPAFKSFKTLNSTERHDSFMGSDFTYSGISGRQINEDTHTLIKKTDSRYFIESIPNNDDAYYGKIRYIIDRDKTVILKAIFYDLNNKKLKELDNKSFQQFKDIYVAVNMIMQNHQTGGTTQLTVEMLKVGDSIDDAKLGLKGLKE